MSEVRVSVEILPGVFGSHSIGVWEPKIDFLNTLSLYFYIISFYKLIFLVRSSAIKSLHEALWNLKSFCLSWIFTGSSSIYPHVISGDSIWFGKGVAIFNNLYPFIWISFFWESALFLFMGLLSCKSSKEIFYLRVLSIFSSKYSSCFNPARTGVVISLSKSIPAAAAFLASICDIN